MQWDLFCRVVDNFGDIGVCWRLAAALASRGERVRLRTDDPSSLAWMAPRGAAGVTVLPWEGDSHKPGDVVVEAFGCELPKAFVLSMAATAPVWINLEYLSAEGYVERAHKLVSPQLTGAGAGLRKWFFYPGFTPLTGGLLREPDLLQRQKAFDRAAWLQSHGAAPRVGERVVSLFCYEQAALPSLLDDLAQEPTLLLATFGTAARAVAHRLGNTLQRRALRAVELPALSQPDYDHLLWSADLNFVRGEDSFVRAQWAGKPFVWQIYPQDDGVHRAKLDAFLARFGADPTLTRFWHAWNGDAVALPPLPPAASWGAACQNWRTQLLGQVDLATQLIDFAVKAR